MPVPLVPSRTRICSRCREPVWVDEQVVDRADTMEIVCRGCGAKIVNAEREAGMTPEFQVANPKLVAETLKRMVSHGGVRMYRANLKTSMPVPPGPAITRVCAVCTAEVWVASITEHYADAMTILCEQCADMLMMAHAASGGEVVVIPAEENKSPEELITEHETKERRNVFESDCEGEKDRGGWFR